MVVSFSRSQSMAAARVTTCQLRWFAVDLGDGAIAVAGGLIDVGLDFLQQRERRAGIAQPIASWRGY